MPVQKMILSQELNGSIQLRLKKTVLAYFTNLTELSFPADLDQEQLKALLWLLNMPEKTIFLILVYVMECSWQQLNLPEMFAVLKKLIPRKLIKKPNIR